jgi:hypothetical protein
MSSSKMAASAVQQVFAMAVAVLRQWLSSFCNSFFMIFSKHGFFKPCFFYI